VLTPQGGITTVLGAGIAVVTSLAVFFVDAAHLRVATVVGTDVAIVAYDGVVGAARGRIATIICTQGRVVADEGLARALAVTACVVGGARTSIVAWKRVAREGAFAGDWIAAIIGALVIVFA